MCLVSLKGVEMAVEVALGSIDRPDLGFTMQDLKQVIAVP